MADTVIVKGKLLKETEAAYLVEVEEAGFGTDAVTFWVPKSVCTYGGVDEFEIEEWFADKEGMDKYVE